jgi:hypothetical protein
MTVAARRIVATPARPASEAWQVIVDLLAPQKELARKELQSVVGIASMLIADEALKDSPAVVFGAGPRVRLYCLYGEDAVTRDRANESALPFVATEGDWRMSLPCAQEDLSWVQAALRKDSTRITARDLAESVDEADNSDQPQPSGELVDQEAFFRQ